MYALLIFGPAALAAVLAIVAYYKPAVYLRLSESVRNVALIAGIVLLSWNTAVTATIYALYSTGLLKATLFDKTLVVQKALILFSAPTIVAVFGGVWLYASLLQILPKEKLRKAATA